MTSSERILKAAEDRIRTAGYNGFSFRDIAQDTGLTNAGVHHHFPTKADLAAYVARDYTRRFVDALDATPPEARVARLKELFAESLKRDGKMCLCGLLAAERGALPDQVRVEVEAFFSGITKRLVDSFQTSPDPEGAALSMLARLEGAILLAQMKSDNDVFERAMHN